MSDKKPTIEEMLSWFDLLVWNCKFRARNYPLQGKCYCDSCDYVREGCLKSIDTIRAIISQPPAKTVTQEQVDKLISKIHSEPFTLPSRLVRTDILIRQLLADLGIEVEDKS